VTVDEGEESTEFLDLLDQPVDEAIPKLLEHTLDLYRVFPKMAPELEDHILASGSKLKKGLLVADGVFILDAGTEISLWIGKEALPEARSSSNKLLSVKRPLILDGD
jgi:Gelsolin repeat